jgi:hypothetical protein
MLTPEIKALMRQQAEIGVRLGEELNQFLSNPQNIQPIIAPLMDGTIDAGDFEAVSEKLLEILRSFTAYQQLLDFTKTSRKALAELYRKIGNGNDADFDAFILLGQNLAAEIATSRMFQKLVELKVVADRRA